MQMTFQELNLLTGGTLCIATQVTPIVFEVLSAVGSTEDEVFLELLGHRSLPDDLLLATWCIKFHHFHHFSKIDSH